MIIRKEGIVAVSIDGNVDEEIKLKGSSIGAMELAEYLNCECYAVNSDKTICASILVNNKRRRIFILKQNTHDDEVQYTGHKIYFNNGHLSKELINKYAHIVTDEKNIKNSKYIIYKLDDIPSYILRKFYVILPLKT